jgi:hypothetical protein
VQPVIADGATRIKLDVIGRHTGTKQLIKHRSLVVEQILSIAEHPAVPRIECRRNIVADLVTALSGSRAHVDVQRIRL